MLKAKLVSATGIAGSGPGGRIVEKDVIAHLKARNYDALRITPAARNLAAKEVIDILDVAGGPPVSLPAPGEPAANAAWQRVALP